MIFNVKIINISNMGTPSRIPSPNGQTLPTPSLSRNIFLKGGNPIKEVSNQFIKTVVTGIDSASNECVNNTEYSDSSDIKTLQFLLRKCAFMALTYRSPIQYFTVPVLHFQSFACCVSR